MCAVVLDAAGKRAFMFSGDWGKICLTFFWHMWIDDTGWKKQKINRLIYSPLSLMKHPPRHIERSREKNVFFVCFRYFQRVNIEAKIIDWVLTELLPFFLLASSSRSLSRLFNTCSRHWNCLQLKQHTSPRLKHATLSTIKSPNPTAVPHLDDPPRRRHKNTWKIIIPLNRKLNKFFAAAGVFGNLFYDPSQWCLFHITRTQ